MDHPPLEENAKTKGAADMQDVSDFRARIDPLKRAVAFVKRYIIIKKQ